MAAITGSFPAGPYTATWNATDIGLMEGPIRAQQNVIALPIRASQWGQTIIDYILQGAGYFVVLVLKEWTTNAKLALWPYGTTQGIVNEAGILLNTLAKPLVLTATTGTPAATYGPVTRTYALSLMLPGHNLDITMGPVERNVPVVFGVLPQPSAGGSFKAAFLVDT